MRDIMRNTVLDWIHEDDPAYDPIPLACERAGVPLTTYMAATDRVYIDGWYGPITRAQWDEEDGRTEVGALSDALRICCAVWDQIDEYRRVELEDCRGEICGDEPCEGHEYEVGVVERKHLLDALVPWFTDIYGYSAAYAQAESGAPFVRQS